MGIFGIIDLWAEGWKGVFFMKILLVGFTGHEDASKLFLDLSAPRHYQDKLYLDTQAERAEKELIAHMEHKKYGYLILVAMKDTIAEDNQLEFVVSAAKEKDMLKTNFIYEELYECLAGQKTKIHVIETPEDGVANRLYYSALKYIEENKKETRCLLINLPAIAQIDVMELSLRITNYFAAAVKAK